jgi:hypothetical protein
MTAIESHFSTLQILPTEVNALCRLSGNFLMDAANQSFGIVYTDLRTPPITMVSLTVYLLGW